VVKDKKDYVLVVDPPRAGLDKTVIDTILKNPPERIVYVSCSPATLTRDIALLKDAFHLDGVTLYDMFPQTPHVETLCVLQKQ
ncbi:MAG: 23S rRNA (uracil(1939)-C(5))-methyltransferase RlmD, partial [Clostridia bacterium]|nr:23S rRNA (uracil(1939)-C(5))-methyltransferase RlmD [Clostridia bacterium]